LDVYTETSIIAKIKCIKFTFYGLCA